MRPYWNNWLSLIKIPCSITTYCRGSNLSPSCSLLSCWVIIQYWVREPDKRIKFRVKWKLPKGLWVISWVILDKGVFISYNANSMWLLDFHIPAWFLVQPIINYSPDDQLCSGVKKESSENTVVSPRNMVTNRASGLSKALFFLKKKRLSLEFPTHRERLMNHLGKWCLTCTLKELVRSLSL